MKLLAIIFVSIFTLATFWAFFGHHLLEEKARASVTTSMEWTPFGFLIVTYPSLHSFYSSKTKTAKSSINVSDQFEVECTAFNADGKAIGGDENVSSGGVARVKIQVPDKYVGQGLAYADIVFDGYQAPSILKVPGTGPEYNSYLERDQAIWNDAARRQHDIFYGTSQDADDVRGVFNKDEVTVKCIRTNRTNIYFDWFLKLLGIEAS